MEIVKMSQAEKAVRFAQMVADFDTIPAPTWDSEYSEERKEMQKIKEENPDDDSYFEKFLIAQAKKVFED